ncbi:MAG: hypothetical protein IJK56_09185 [Firmicutes bacterium]|nr:hypothetical protein [Bacillota bacterium]
MIGLLVRKQWKDIFKNFYYNPKNNKPRSKAGVIGYYIFYLFLIVGVIGGMFTMMALGICESMSMAGMGWLYFTIFGIMGILLGAFGSVFSTYSGLYLAKDNDLLFSLPIPVNAIMISRLLIVYLMGLMYAASVALPAVIVYWVTVSAAPLVLLGGIVFVAVISLIVMILSCLLGYVVARISLKLKNKGVLTALAAVIFFVLYYVVYFRFGQMMGTLVENMGQIGADIKKSFYGLYMFGRIGEGDLVAMLIYVAATGALFALTWYILNRSFLKISTATGAVSKAVYKEKTVKQKSTSGALLSREFRRFTGSANYMLNCGMGSLMLILLGGAILWKGETVFSLFGMLLDPNLVLLILAAILCMLSGMVYPATASVSLEGKNIWIAKSSPVSTWQILSAKVRMQLLLAGIPMCFVLICCVISVLRFLKADPLMIVLFVVLVCVFVLFSAFWDLIWGIKGANLNWSNEIYVIKQGLPVTASLFGSWLIMLLLVGLFFLLRKSITVTVFTGIVAAILAIAAFVEYKWLRTKGVEHFETL